MSDNSQIPQYDPAGFSTDSYIKRVEMPWGYELHWVQTNEPYMGKIIHIDAGKRIGLQLHDEKRESWLIINGQAELVWEDSNGKLVKTTLQPRQGYSTQVGQWHRLIGITDCDIIEVSTPERGTTWRLEDDYKNTDENPDQKMPDKTDN
jgi:mannose-6-phosphate isomerase